MEQVRLDIQVLEMFFFKSHGDPPSLSRSRSTLQVIRTMACEYALCSLFVPGDRQIILGTKVFEDFKACTFLTDSMCEFATCSESVFCFLLKFQLRTSVRRDC